MQRCVGYESLFVCLFVWEFVCLRLEAFIPTTTLIRDIRTLLQIRQFAHLRSATCSMQGLNPTLQVQGPGSRGLGVGLKGSQDRPEHRGRVGAHVQPRSET